MTTSLLLVDDDPALLRALPEALRLSMPDLAVTTASSAAEARELAADNDFDAIVTDIKMPGTDGLELLGELRRLLPTTPTLLITGHGERDLAVQALRGGAYDFIQKPIDRDYIVAALRRAIRSRRLTREVEEQRRALARHARVLGQMSEGVFVVADDGRIELWNAAAAAVTGIPAEDAVERPVADVFTRWEDTAGVVEVSGSETLGFAPSRIVPVEVPAGELWLSFKAVRLDNGVIYTFRDASVERSIDELTSDLLATVSHELRTPIASVYGAAMTLAAHEPVDDERRHALLGVLVAEAGRLRRLVEDMLVASALESARISLCAEPVDPVSLVQGIADAMRLVSSDEARIVLELPDRSPPHLLTDRDKLQQVLTNLVENALKYAPDGSEVVVGVEPRETSLRFFVRDSGPGIPPDEQRRIFDKFYRVDPERNGGVRGSGLGLYVSRELVRRMEGRLGVLSAPQAGSTFFVDLPLELSRVPEPAS